MIEILEDTYWYDVVTKKPLVEKVLEKGLKANLNGVMKYEKESH